MSITKKNIIKNINKESLISIEDGSNFLESFLLVIKKQAKFVIKTNQLFESIGSTLMVKASKNFNEINLNLIII